VAKELHRVKMFRKVLSNAMEKKTADRQESQKEQLKLEILLLHNASSRGIQVGDVNVPLKTEQRTSISSALQERYAMLERLKRA
jgi:hypothetical protein